MNHSFFARRSFTILVVVFFMLPLIWAGTRRAIRNNRNDIKTWLPEDYKATETHRWFKEHFPHEQFVLISWEGCTLEDSRLELLAQKLVPPEVPKQLPAGVTLEQLNAAPAEPKYFKSALTGRRLIDQLQARYPELSRQQVLRRLEGSLIGADHEKTCLVVTLAKTYRGRELRAVLEKIRQVATHQCAIPREQLRMGGPPVDNAAIDYEGERTLFRLAGLSALVGLGISWLCFRSFRLTAMVFATAILAAGTGMAIVFFTGGIVDAILLSMPSLVYVLAISGAIHIINYYNDAVRDHGLEGAPDRALGHGWWPCAIAALTTALGLGSLLTSNLIPIRNFGLYSALGVLATLFWLFLFLPALLHYRLPMGELGRRMLSWFLPRQTVDEYVDRRQQAIRDAAGRGLEDSEDTIFLRFWRALGGTVIRHNGWVTVGCLAIMVFFAVGVYRIETSVKLMKLFAPGAEIITHYAWLEKHLGPLVPMEVVIRFDNEKCKLSFVDRMRLVQQVESTVETLDDVGGALSAATFAPDIKPDKSKGGVLEKIIGINRRRQRDRILSNKLEEHRPEFHEYLTVSGDATLKELGISGPLAKRLAANELDTIKALQQYGELESIEGVGPQQAAEVAAAIGTWKAAHGEELWRVSARVWALDDDLDYGVFIYDIQDKVDPVIAHYQKHGVEGLSATYTGLVPLIYQAQRQLMHGLFNSLELAFVLIAVVMVLVLRSPSAGLLAMVPNLFPVVLIFGMMGWLGILVDVGSMMTASVALGVAVDDTIHYLAWFRDGLDQGKDRKGAAMWAYQRCATAMSQTTLIGGLGLAVFAFSTFTPTQRFGYLMLTLLAAALVGDLIFLPALLCGPIGRFFRVRGKRTKRSADELPPDEAADGGSEDELIAVPIARDSASRPDHGGDPRRSTRAS